MVKKYPYVTVFERTRVLGDIIAPVGLNFKTELAPGEVTEELILHISCQVLNVPHVAYIAQKTMEKMGLRFTTLGGPENCCGAYHWHFGDLDLERQVAKISLNTFRRAKARTVLSLCPSCDDSFGRHKAGNQAFRQCNITELFVERLPELRAMMRPVPCRIVVHDHNVDETRRRNSENVLTLLGAIPGVEILPAHRAEGPGIGCQSVAPMSREATVAMFEEAKALGADSIVLPYHSCYRQHLKMRLEFGVDVQHYLEILATSLGIPFENRFKELRLLDSVDKAVDALRPRMQRFDYKESDVRKYVQAVIYM
jgi:Fe-S oxidoreductase